MNRVVLTQERLEDLQEFKVPVSSGSVVSFWGRVRNHNEGRPVHSLDYSAYPELAVKEGQRILDEALKRWQLDAVRAAHRVGSLGLGEAAVVVEVASGHRGEGFEACRWIIDEIKARVPLWKNEHYSDSITTAS